jgi:hypothetical protein
VNSFTKNHLSKAFNFQKPIGLKVRFAGVESGGDTPDPIPNSAVKTARGDGTAG